ncbi:hypothetical protein [Pseudarthrobacter enclensis]|uniref:hypothetical protein n=1 Tax=Pseudarthrobacter enclensis TaxID=993070 RepID=UPI003EE15345
MVDRRRSAQELALRDPGYVADLWPRYWAHGGAAARDTFATYLHRKEEWDEFELRILAWAMDELSAVLPEPRFHGSETT